MPSFSSTVLGLMAALSLAVPGVLATFANSSSDVRDAISSLKTDPDGYLHIADDGVARAFDANDTVTGYVALSNDQLMQLLAELPELWQNETDHLHSVFDGVDGRDANQTQLLNPPASLRPNRGAAQSQNDKRAPFLKRPARLHAAIFEVGVVVERPRLVQNDDYQVATLGCDASCAAKRGVHKQAATFVHF
ncbi:hypothetical protein TSTA_095930 [Talaromyces stipitatus ATCC 10500]|uniref:Uncharacterized protein n=1 Tax=Talaromyces stipitatus (strain ATCC 10500 / CBS 375.48 / QM 6759 / NRRL 1006) TaxID=441959 RepID=B8M3H2_TALSN|nr:uncharacterized protein TSTA_095930 [Talaromyces stipitatus ATCC 10500]EED22344.1 hypothetical protein TSTA_095930 [Talaromyces stipitatus ATCC 10500]